MNATALETLRTAALPTLTGTPKQIAFASKIRAAWRVTQIAHLETELRIVGGAASVVSAPDAMDGDLVFGTDPKCEELRDGGVAMFHARAKGLARDMARTSAKAWIESLEGQWVLKHGPMKRAA